MIVSGGHVDYMICGTICSIYSSVVDPTFLVEMSFVISGVFKGGGAPPPPGKS